MEKVSQSDASLIRAPSHDGFASEFKSLPTISDIFTLRTEHTNIIYVEACPSI